MKQSAKKTILGISFILMAQIISAVEITVDGIVYKLNDKTASIKNGNNASGDLIIPDSINYEGENYEVTSIEEYAFENCSSLTSITLPDGMTDIGFRAFFCCYDLQQVKLPNNLKELGVSAFESCWSLTQIEIPEGISIIKDMTFGQCGLVSISIPSSVWAIEPDAFGWCSKLSAVNISDIGAWCYIDFYPNDFISFVTPFISNPLAWGADLYLNGELVTDLVIPDWVTDINDYAFEGCRSITSITIPNDISYIGVNAFLWCPIYDIYCYASDAPIIEGDFWYNYDAVLHVPASSIDIYKSTEPWCNFTTIVPIDDDEPVNLNSINPHENTVHTSASDGTITLRGLKEKEIVTFYAANGSYLGQTEANKEGATFTTKATGIVLVKTKNQNFKITLR